MLRPRALLSIVPLLVLSACGKDGPPSELGSRPASTVQDDPASALPEPQLPLKTRGRFIVDAQGQRFKLASVNWYGSSDTDRVPGGLDRAPLSAIIDSIIALGFNSVRLPFANAILHDTNPVDAKTIAQNLEFAGKTPLQVFDAVVHSLTSRGLLVILNNHRSQLGWCCGYDGDGLWYDEQYSETRWLSDWADLARRYRANPRVVGADLRNEVRTAKWKGSILPSIPHWGHGPNDWRAAAERGGAAVLEANPELLVIVEGINYPREHLRGVLNDPIRLPVPDKLVYAAHHYAHIGPSLTGKKYGAMTEDELASLVEEEWAFVTKLAQSYTAPLWISEFGASHQGDERDWFERFAKILRHHDLDFAYWALNAGPKPSGEAETFALLEDDWKTPRTDYRSLALKDLKSPRLGPGVEPDWQQRPENHFETLMVSDWDHELLQAGWDWAPHAYKASCRKGYSVVGLSAGQRGGQPFTHQVLCSAWPTPKPEGSLETREVHGQSEVLCPRGAYMAGVAQKRQGLGYNLDRVLCIQAELRGKGSPTLRSLGRSDDRGSAIPGDFDAGNIKLQCQLDEVAVGIQVRKNKLRGLYCQG